MFHGQCEFFPLWALVSHPEFPYPRNSKVDEETIAKLYGIYQPFRSDHLVSLGASSDLIQLNTILAKRCSINTVCTFALCVSEFDNWIHWSATELSVIFVRLQNEEWGWVGFYAALMLGWQCNSSRPVWTSVLDFWNTFVLLLRLN